jgi:hypothetical protein
MPNWCENELTIRGRAGVLACLEAIRSDSDQGESLVIDFQKIVPMPAVLQETGRHWAEEGRVLLGDDLLGEKMLAQWWAQKAGIKDLDGLRAYIRQTMPGAEEAGRLAIQAYQETGAWDWYDWRAGTIANLCRDGHWGTKWNSYQSLLDGEPTDSRADIAFCTAWSPPLPVITQLSRQFPRLSFTLKYWEGCSGFRGILRVKAGRELRNATYPYGGPRGG